MKDSVFQRGQVSTDLFKNPYVRRYFKNLGEKNSMSVQVSPSKEYSLKGRSSPIVFSCAETSSTSSSKGSVLKPDTKTRFQCKEITFTFGNEECRPNSSYKSILKQSPIRNHSNEQLGRLESSPAHSIQQESMVIKASPQSDILIFDSKLVSPVNEDLGQSCKLKLDEEDSVQDSWHYEFEDDIDTYKRCNQDDISEKTARLETHEKNTEHKKDLMKTTKYLFNDIPYSIQIQDEDCIHKEAKPTEKTPLFSAQDFNLPDAEIEEMLDTLLDKHVLKGLRILGGFSDYLKKH